MSEITLAFSDGNIYGKRGGASQRAVLIRIRRTERSASGGKTGKSTQISGGGCLSFFADDEAIKLSIPFSPSFPPGGIFASLCIFVITVFCPLAVPKKVLHIREKRQEKKATRIAIVQREWRNSSLTIQHLSSYCQAKKNNLLDMQYLIKIQGLYHSKTAHVCASCISLFLRRRNAF